jgi:dihydroorotate dehydrogenase
MPHRHSPHCRATYTDTQEICFDRAQTLDSRDGYGQGGGMSLYCLLRPLVFQFPPERAHGLAVRALAHGLVPPCPARPSEALRVACFGLSFPSPVGLAAGFDKNAEVTAPLLAQGFGFVEAGTVTPRPQEGNPQPRLFRLEEDAALINRLGFNNEGMEAVRARLERRRREDGIVGINIGKNKDTEHAADDYRLLLRELGALAEYVTVNISSPNTAGLRDLQHKEALASLLGALLEERARLPRPVKLLLKIAPDLDDAALEAVAQTVRALRVDGVILGNTTLGRPETLKSPHRNEEGGLSGAPLMARSTERLRSFYRLTEGEIPLIGVGGVGSAADALEKIRAGASLVQLYSALVYQGFGLVRRITRGLEEELRRTGAKHISELVGTAA